MKRTPLQRTVGLARGATPLPRTALRRGRPLSTRSADTREGRQQPAGGAGKPKAGRDWPPEVREALTARSGGTCEWCWVDPATDAHHRLRRREGVHTIQNAVHLCRPCHRDRVHGQPKQAREYGFIVPTWNDPATVPVLLGGSRWALLTTDGKYRTDPRGWPIA